MSFDFTADLDFMLAECGVAVAYGASATGDGILDEMEEQDFATGQVLGTVRTLTVRTSTFPGLVNGAAITVDGTSYTIRDHREFEDGALTRILLGG